jgi:hypothetical protein
MPPEQGSTWAAKLRGCEQHYNGNVYVEPNDRDQRELFALITEGTNLAISPNFPAFVALDRFVAQPARLSLLDDRAVRYVPPPELEALGQTLEALSELDLAPAQEMLERGNNGARDVEAGLQALRGGLAAARDADLGLLLVCTPS